MVNSKGDRLCWFSVMALLFVSGASGGPWWISQCPNEQASTELRAEPGVAVVVKATEYCQGSTTAYTKPFSISYPDQMLLRLTVTISNTTRRTLIVPRAGMMVSRVAWAPTEPGDDSWLDLDHFHVAPDGYDRDDWPRSDRPPSRDFVLLAPGEIWTYTEHPVVAFPLGDRYVRPGPLVIRTFVRAWYKTPRITERIQERWRGIGVLWTSAVETNSLRVDVRPPANRRYPPCR